MTESSFDESEYFDTESVTISTVSVISTAPPSYATIDPVCYQIAYDWQVLEKFKTFAISSAFIVDSKDCVCNQSWREALHGLNLAVFTTGLRLKVFYFVSVFLVLVGSIGMTFVTFGEYTSQETATLYTIKQKRDLRFPNITLCPKYIDALNMSMVKQDIFEHLTVNVDLNETDIDNVIAFALAGAGFDNFNPFVDSWDEDYRERLQIWFRKWTGNRALTDFYDFLTDKAGYKCEDMLLSCYYAGDELPCCQIFRFSYVMLRGRCLKLREFYQEDPALTGTLTVYIKNLSSNVLMGGDYQPQTILYVSDRYPDVFIFPRYYLAPKQWNQLSLSLQTISLLPANSQCTNLTSLEGEGTCLVNTWLKRRVVQPLNCTLFYFKDKHPHLPVCQPKQIVETYYNVVNLAFNNNTRCLPSCFRRTTSMSLQVTAITASLVQDLPDSVFQLEFAYNALQEEMFQEILTTTAPGVIAEISGQFGLFLGINIFTLVYVFLLGLLIITVLSTHVYKKLKYHNF